MSRNCRKEGKIAARKRRQRRQAAGRAVCHRDSPSMQKKLRHRGNPSFHRRDAETAHHSLAPSGRIPRGINARQFVRDRGGDPGSREAREFHSSSPSGEEPRNAQQRSVVHADVHVRRSLWHIKLALVRNLVATTSRDRRPLSQDWHTLQNHRTAGTRGPPRYGESSCTYRR